MDLKIDHKRLYAQDYIKSWLAAWLSKKVDCIAKNFTMVKQQQT